MVVLRLMAVGLHLLKGVGICAFLFPITSPAKRESLIRGWSRHLLEICGIRLVIRGEISAAPALIVCNHISWLDIFAINACKPCRFVAKSDVRDWPVIGWLCARAGTIFIARGRQRDVRRIFQRLVSSIHSGERIAFFPEGTTSGQGKMQSFHANLFEAAIDADVPIQPYALRYLDSSGALHSAPEYIGDTTFMQSMIVILRHRGIIAELSVLPEIPNTVGSRRALAAATHASIATALDQAETCV